MRNRIGIVLALAGALTFASAAGAQEGLDTSRLPRLPGAKELFANPATTIFTVAQPVPAVAEAVVKALAAQGWQAYGDPYGRTSSGPTILNLKKGSQGLTVMVSVSPAQPTLTSVNYVAAQITNELPFPADATEIVFDSNQPILRLRSAQTLDASLAFFRKELTARGYALWSRQAGGKQEGGPDGEIHDKGAYAYYVRDTQRPLLLILERDGAALKVELKGVPASVLVAERKPDTPAVPAPQPRAVDDGGLGKEIDNIARSIIADALSGARPAPPRAPAAAPSVQAETLRAMATSPGPIPVPETAQEVEFSDGSFEFSTASNVASVAAFYRAQMKTLGWQERRTPIDRPNMVSLDFRKGEQQLSLTVMQMGPKTSVRGNGSALAGAKPKAEPRSQSASLAPPSAPQPLEVDEMGGLPVPKSSTSKGTERTPFRTVLTANVPASVPSVLAFYRAELGKRSWTEEKQGASAGEDAARVAFASPEGPAVLTLSRKSGDTVVELSLRKPAEAEKAGVLPKPGQAKVLFGNVLDKEASVTVGKQTVKVGAGVGSKAADGPKLDLPPGKHRFSIRVAGMPPQSEDVEIGAGETWGLLIGPGGVLPLQAY